MCQMIPRVQPNGFSRGADILQATIFTSAHNSDIETRPFFWTLCQNHTSNLTRVVLAHTTCNYGSQELWHANRKDPELVGHICPEGLNINKVNYRYATVEVHTRLPISQSKFSGPENLLCDISSLI